MTSQEVNDCTSSDFGNAGADWLGTSRGTPSEGPSHHSVLDSSQPCWHPSLRPPYRHPHPEASSFITQTLVYQHAFFPDSVGLWNNLSSDLCSGSRSTRQTSRPKDSSNEPCTYRKKLDGLRLAHFNKLHFDTCHPNLFSTSTFSPLKWEYQSTIFSSCKIRVQLGFFF